VAFEHPKGFSAIVTKSSTVKVINYKFCLGACAQAVLINRLKLKQTKQSRNVEKNNNFWTALMEARNAAK
jgi:hypothetical protein